MCVQYQPNVFQNVQKCVQTFDWYCVCVCQYLMGSADEVQVMAVEELADYIRSKGEGDPAVVLSPALHVLVWV